jgi:ANTAR domain
MLGHVAGFDLPGEASRVTADTHLIDRAETGRAQDPQERIRQLQTALDTRVVIEQAKGILAERFQLPIDEAFGLLRYSARASRMSLRALAGAVVEHPEVTPAEIAGPLARPDRWRIASLTSAV